MSYFFAISRNNCSLTSGVTTGKLSVNKLQAHIGYRIYDIQQFFFFISYRYYVSSYKDRNICSKTLSSSKDYQQYLCLCVESIVP